MTSLVIAEHDNAAIKTATLNTVTAARPAAVMCMCWWPAKVLALRPQPLPRSPVLPRSSTRTAHR